MTRGESGWWELCDWCGQLLAPEAAHYQLVHDPVTGEYTLLLTACSAQHLHLRWLRRKYEPDCS